MGNELKNVEHLWLSATCSPADYPADAQDVAGDGACTGGTLAQDHLLEAQLNMYVNYSAADSPAEQKLQQMFTAETLAKLPSLEGASGQIQYAQGQKAKVGGDFSNS